MRKRLAYWLVPLLLVQCTEEKYSPDYVGRITAMEVEGEASPTLIDDNEFFVSITLNNDPQIDLSDLTVTRLEFSEGAKVINLDPDTLKNFSKPVTMQVQGTDEFVFDWTITAQKDGAQLQIPYSDLNTWYEQQSGSKTFLNVGENAETTVWASGNEGVLVYNDEANTYPLNIGDGTLFARMETVRAVPPIAPIAGGSLFVGTFKLNILDPASSPQFGTPFRSRPKGFEVEYRYKPEIYRKSGEDVVDECDIYVLLEKRMEDEVQRVATAWFRSNLAQPDWTTLDMTLVYGEDPSLPSYAQPKKGQTFAPADATPTHIVIVFASSAGADVFDGGIGSTLDINNFKLNY
ncbi:hypothetical protein FUAX_10580 [Fulvitalea axinellae]|uniref:Putative carbohydrate metabolism domain-containing protein n=1 Tax=Fulvitalea axinellae TaxID=1182444 RepID=A0AAU9CIB9_9BACT|nr:hypothetical protein FUAX_10580 [Fulvitalea axinellae]